MTRGHIRLTPENCPHDSGWIHRHNSITNIETYICARGCGYWITKEAGKVIANYKNQENEPATKVLPPLSKEEKL